MRGHGGKWSVRVVAAVIALLSVGCRPAPAPSGFTVVHHDVGLVSAEDDPHTLVQGFDGALWYAGVNVGSVERYDIDSGEHTSYPLPADALVHQLLATPDGSVFASTWAPTTRGRLFRVTTTHGAVEVLDLGPDSILTGMAHDGLDGIWLSEPGFDRILRYSYADGVTAEYPVGDGVMPTAIVAGPDGDVWFVPAGREGLGRLDPATGQVEVSQVPSPSTLGGTSYSLVRGPGRTLWYAIPLQGRIVRHDIDSGASLDVVLPEGAKPTSVVAGLDGAVWATVNCVDGAGLVRIDPSTGTTTNYDVDVAWDSAPFSPVEVAGSFWFVTTSEPGLHHATPVGPVA